jgi:hypothetical protein
MTGTAAKIAAVMPPASDPVFTTCPFLNVPVVALCCSALIKQATFRFFVNASRAREWRFEIATELR